MSCTSFFKLLHRHNLAMTILQVPIQGPRWHRSWHLWILQLNILSQVAPHNGTATSHDIPSYTLFPQGQVLFPWSGHPPHCPTWQPLSHTCFPQSRAFPQAFSHLKSLSQHSLCSSTLPHRHMYTARALQGGQGPSWQICKHLWVLQSKGFEQILLHENDLNPQRRTSWNLRQKQDELTNLGQGGQGPGWHNNKQKWPQLFCNGLLHISLQECGKIQGSSLYGSSNLPQKQRYFLGIWDFEYWDRHLGQFQVEDSAAFSAVIGRREAAREADRSEDWRAHDWMQIKWKIE